jgi:DNA-binding CsgD family transcriptional regulator
LLDLGGTQRLSEARVIASRLGMMSTVAVLDLQLAGAYLQRYNIDAAAAAAGRSVSMCEALRLSRLQAGAHVFQACIAAMRGERAEAERATADALRQAPDDPEVLGLTATGASGMLDLLWGSRKAALAHMNRGMTVLHQVPHSPPGPYRGLWPLVVAVEASGGRADATAALQQVQRSGVAVNRVNRGYLAYAEAVADRSAAALARGDADLVMFPVWRHIGRALAAEAALRDGWGEPRQWLAEARACLTSTGLNHLAEHIDRLLTVPGRWVPSGASLREIDVLDLLTAGLPNREIAERLHLSVRTVEKHVESLLRKSATRSRTELTAMARERSLGENT